MAKLTYRALIEAEQKAVIMDFHTQVDGYEKILAASRRTSRASITMLTDALHALESGKTHVVKDHIERTIDRLAHLRDSYLT